MLILANQTPGLFDPRYLQKKYTCTISLFFHADRHISNNKKKTANLLILHVAIP